MAEAVRDMMVIFAVHEAFFLQAPVKTVSPPITDVAITYLLKYLGYPPVLGEVKVFTRVILPTQNPIWHVQSPKFPVSHFPQISHHLFL